MTMEPPPTRPPQWTALKLLGVTVGLIGMVGFGVCGLCGLALDAPEFGVPGLLVAMAFGALLFTLLKKKS